MTIVGDISFPRRYYACDHCHSTGVPMDDWAGIGSRAVSDHARRVIVLAGSTWSFEEAAAKLLELCQLRTSNDTVRAVCNEEGQAAEQWLRKHPQSAAPLQAAVGEWEFSSDGTSVNTTDGWREIRLSVLSKRESAEPATPQQWHERVLPRSAGRLAWCQIADCERVGARWERMFEHVGVGLYEKLSVLADGARWIWEQAGKRLPQSDIQWVVDVYHVSEHLHDCAKELFPDAKQAESWADKRLLRLIELGGPRFLEELEGQVPRPLHPGGEKALRKLRGYLQENADRMWYRQRLAEGRAIGSGLIEGGCKNILGKRLKLNSARWRIQRAERMGTLRCLQYSGLWGAYWESN